jgi:hypothetical protein
MNQPPIADFVVGPRALRNSLGLPHPLAKFGIAGHFDDGLFADIVLHFINVTRTEEPNSRPFKAAMWFLLESERTYLYVCAEAGIDALRLRDHLRKGFELPVGWE